MRRVAAISLVALCAIGCGGGGSAGSTVNQNGQGQGDMVLPSVTTTYNVTFGGAMAHSASNTATLTLQPSGSFTMTSNYGPGFSATGTLAPSPGSTTMGYISGSLTFNGAGLWQSEPVQSGVDYTLGGNVSLLNGSAVIAQAQFAGGGTAYASFPFTGDAR